MMLAPNILMSGEFSQFQDMLKERFPIRKHFQRGELVSGMLDRRNDHCYYVLSGVVGCSSLDEMGSSHSFPMRGAGTIFPLFYEYETMTEGTLEFVALEDVELIVIPKVGLREAFAEDFELSMAMMNAWAVFSTYLVYSQEALFESVWTRVCTFLYLHTAASDVLRMSHADIAQAIGVRRESVSRELCVLKRRGIVSLGRCQIQVLNRAALRSEASGMVSMQCCS